MPDPTAKVVIEAVRRGAGAFASFNSDLEALKRRAILVGTAAAAALAVLTKRSFENVDALAKTADAIGVTTEKLAGLQLAGQITGVQQEQFNKALLRQQKTIYDASKGLTTATRALDDLGLSVNDLLGLSADQQFAKIAKAMEGVENATIRSGAAAQIYGARNVAVLKTLELGEEGLKRYQEQAERTGIAVNRIDAAKIEQANDAVTLAKRSMEGLANIIAVELAPVVQGLATSFSEAASDSEDMGRRVHSVIDGIAKGVGLVGDAFYGWKLIFAEIDVGIDELRSKIADIVTDSATSRLTEFAADISGVGAQFDITKTIAEAYRSDIEEAAKASQAHLDVLIASERPSKRIAEALAAAREEAERTARATAEIATSKAANAGSAPPETEDEKRARDAAEKEAERERKSLEDRLEQVRQYTLSRQQTEIEAIQNRLEIVRNAREQELIDQQRFEQLSAEIARKGQEQLTQIAKEEAEKRAKEHLHEFQKNLQATLSGFADLAQISESGSRELFRIGKAASLANAVVNTHEAVTAVLADKSLPTIARFALAAVAAAKGLAEVNAIRSTSFGGGGGGTASAVGGSSTQLAPQPIAPLPAQTDPSQGRHNTTVNIYVEGSLIGTGGTTALAQEMTELLRDHVDKTDDTLITVTSRNGQVLSGV